MRVLPLLDPMQTCRGPCDETSLTDWPNHWATGRLANISLCVPLCVWLCQCVSVYLCVCVLKGQPFMFVRILFMQKLPEQFHNGSKEKSTFVESALKCTTTATAAAATATAKGAAATVAATRTWATKSSRTCAWLLPGRRSVHWLNGADVKN